MEAIRIPTLILCGDEDEACVEPSLFMKRHIPGSGLAFFPKSGHAIARALRRLRTAVSPQAVIGAGTRLGFDPGVKTQLA
jgi:alpha-beta hydrolase superfamily lysophospholipase